MPHLLDDLRDRWSPPGPTASGEFRPLRMIAAPLLLLTGLEATRDSLRRAAPTRSFTGMDLDDRPRSASLAASWAPTLLAPLAAAAQLARLTGPSDSASAASRILNAAVVGAGVAAAADMISSMRHRGTGPSLAPVALATAGLLAMVLDRQEEVVEENQARLERRAALVERLVPQRRPKLDRVVVHV